MKTFLLLMSLIVCTCCEAQSENEIPKLRPEPPFIEVTGTATKEVVPDKIFISVILSEKVVNNQTYTITVQEEKLKKALTKINIDLLALSLSDASSEITTCKNKETGFKVTKEYMLMVSNATQVSDVFRELYAINTKEASVVKVERSDIESLRKQVRIAAIQAAKDKADYLVKAVDEELGKPLEIHEQEEAPFFSSYLSNTMLTQNEGRTNSDPSPTDFRKFTVKFSYYIKYAIK